MGLGYRVESPLGVFPHDDCLQAHELVETRASELAFINPCACKWYDRNTVKVTRAIKPYVIPCRQSQ